MYVKLTNGQPNQFPYTIGQFRRDNSGTSFPKIIPDTMLRRWGVFPVEELAQPNYTPLTQNLVLDAMPHKEVIRLKTEEDAMHPVTGEVIQEEVGQPIYGNRWLMGCTVENKPQNEAEDSVRDKRNSVLSKTDWMALSDNTMMPEWANYRQALRDIPDQAGFPNTINWPIEP